MNKILYRVVDILKITGFSRSTLYKMIGDGRFPTPKKIGKSVYWKKEQIDNWLEQL